MISERRLGRTQNSLRTALELDKGQDGDCEVEEMGKEGEKEEVVKEEEVKEEEDADHDRGDFLFLRPAVMVH